MNNSELFKTLNNVAETKRQIKQEEIAKKNEYAAFISEFKNALIELTKLGDFVEKNNSKQIEGKIVFEKSIDLDDAQQTFYTKVYGFNKLIELSNNAYLRINNESERRIFIKYFNNSLKDIAKIYEYDDCECFKGKYRSKSSYGYETYNRIFYYRAKF